MIWVNSPGTATRPDQEGDRQPSRFRWRRSLLVICGYWIFIALMHRGWVSVDRLLLRLDGPALFCFAIVIMQLITLILVILAIVHFIRHRTWGAAVPLLLLTGSLLIIIFMPTSASWILRQKRPKFEAVLAQAEITWLRQANLAELRTTRGMLLQIAEVEDGWMERDREADPDVLCVTLMVRNIGLVHTSTGDLEDCRRGDAWPWARRLDQNWFETSYRFSLWFLQPKRAVTAFFRDLTMFPYPG